MKSLPLQEEEIQQSLGQGIGQIAALLWFVRKKREPDLSGSPELFTKNFCVYTQFYFIFTVLDFDHAP